VKSVARAKSATTQRMSKVWQSQAEAPSAEVISRRFPVDIEPVVWHSAAAWPWRGTGSSCVTPSKLARATLRRRRNHTRHRATPIRLLRASEPARKRGEANET
jgi:hypothetical protein